jgi:DNA polymerase III subunit alpha
MSYSGFIHLKAHTSYSLAEGAIKIDDLLKLCIQNKMPAIAVTETGNLFSSLELSESAKKKNIQHIVGCNLQLLFEKNSLTKRYDQISLFVQNEKGYKNLLQLVSDSIIKNRAPVPHITIEQLKNHAEGIIILTSGINGTFGKLLLENNQADGENFLLLLKQIFQDRLYIEISRLGYKQENQIEELQIELAYKHNIPLVATNEIFFANKQMHEAHDILLCIASGNYVVEEGRRKVSAQCYFKSSYEMEQLFADLPEAIANTRIIAQRCSYICKTSAPMLPSAGENEAEELRALARAGLEQRLEDVEVDRDLYFQRLDYELKVILEMNFPGYFLIVHDFIKWSKSVNIPVGPGRGSGAGSIVAWSLGITDLDPIRFGLIFERFLNPERVSIPDFDIDFCQERRDEVISYVQQKYGYERVAQIITFGKLQARAVLRDVGRVLQMPYSFVDKISKLVPFNAVNPVTLAQAIEIEPMLKKLRDEDEQVAKLLSISLQLEGLHRHCSTHAAGVVIGGTDLVEMVPLYSDGKSDMLVVQYSLKYAELAGLVKFDFLGLKTLTVIEHACRNIRKRGTNIDISKIPLDDKKTYELLSQGASVGIFQFESAGMQESLRKLKPDTIEDLLALGALFRPGPMENIPTYIAAKHGKQQPDYLHPKLELILKETFGVIIYQEQVQKIAQVLAGYTLGAADLLRRAMGKKIKEEMDAQREIFVKGALANGVEENQASYIFDLVAKFAGYGFNKSHAAAYGIISYQTAYLKANFPLEFYTAHFNLELDDTDKIFVFQQDAKNMGIKILPPDINKSESTFSIEGEALRFGLGAIKSVGMNAMKTMCLERELNGPFKDIIDFFERCDSKIINKRQLEALIKAGVFDSIHNNRKQLFDSIDMLTTYNNSCHSQVNTNQFSLFSAADSKPTRPKLIESKEWLRSFKLNYEYEAYGFYLNDHPLQDYETYIKANNIRDSYYMKNNLTIGSYSVTLAGVVISTRARVSPRGRYVTAVISDMTGNYEVSVFDNKVLEAAENILVSNIAVLIKADVKKDENGSRLMVRSVSRLDDKMNERYKNLKIWLADLNAVSKIQAIYSSLQRGQTKVTINVIDKGQEIEIELPNGLSISINEKEQIESIEGRVKLELS